MDSSEKVEINIYVDENYATIVENSVVVTAFNPIDLEFFYTTLLSTFASWFPYHRPLENRRYKITITEAD